MKRIRKLKIYSKYRSRKRDNVSIPEIRLEGKWLKELGFNEGNEVLIEQEYNKLVIKLRREQKN